MSACAWKQPLCSEPSWSLYLVVEAPEGEGALCLVCRRLVVATGEPDVRHHYEAEHDYYERYVAEGERAALVERLRQGDLPEAAPLTPEERAARAGLGLARLLALKGCGWGEGDFVHRCMEVMLRDVLPDHVSVLDGIDLSPEITRQRVLDIINAVLLLLGICFPSHGRLETVNKGEALLRQAH